MVGEPVVGVHTSKFSNKSSIFVLTRYRRFFHIKTIRCGALRGCLDTKLFTVIEADI
jgi:hypothetical protein